MKLFFPVILLSVCLNGYANSSEDTLKIGDKAPNLYIQEWIKGQPINKFDSGKLYLIEFSATWCVPCRLLIPHLSEIATKYAGRLEVISIYTLESNPDDPTNLGYVQHIKKFIRSMESKINFSVAVDVPKNEAHEKWVKALGLRGLPSGFLIDANGRIVWADIIGKGVDEIVAAAFSKNGSIADVLTRNALDDKRVNSTIEEIFALKQRGEMKAALDKMDSLIAVYPNTAYFYKKKYELLAGINDDEAYDCLRWILHNVDVRDYDWYHLLANFTAYGVKKPDYLLAHQIADRAIEQAETNIIKAHALREKARIFYCQNDFQNAVDCSSRALKIAKKESSNPAFLAPFEEMLKWCAEALPEDSN